MTPRSAPWPPSPSPKALTLHPFPSLVRVAMLIGFEVLRSLHDEQTCHPQFALRQI